MVVEEEKEERKLVRRGEEHGLVVAVEEVVVVVVVVKVVVVVVGKAETEERGETLGKGKGNGRGKLEPTVTSGRQLRVGILEGMEEEEKGEERGARWEAGSGRRALWRQNTYSGKIRRGEGRGSEESQFLVGSAHGRRGGGWRIKSGASCWQWTIDMEGS